MMSKSTLLSFLQYVSTYIWIELFFRPVLLEPMCLFVIHTSAKWIQGPWTVAQLLIKALCPSKSNTALQILKSCIVTYSIVDFFWLRYLTEIYDRCLKCFSRMSPICSTFLVWKWERITGLIMPSVRLLYGHYQFLQLQKVRTSLH